MIKDEIERGLGVQTSDLILAATLVNLGFNFANLDRSDPSRAIFIFPETQKLQKIIDKFWRGEITVEPKSFSAIQRQLKAQIRNGVETLK